MDLIAYKALRSIELLKFPTLLPLKIIAGTQAVKQ
jgi:hypothetical protein